MSGDGVRFTSYRGSFRSHSCLVISILLPFLNIHSRKIYLLLPGCGGTIWRFNEDWKHTETGQQQEVEMTKVNGQIGQYKKNLNHFLELLFLYTELKKEEERNIWNDSSSSSLVFVSYVLLYTGNGNTKNKMHRHHQPGGPARRKVGHSIDSRLFLHSAATEWQHQAVTGTLVTIQGPAFIFSSIFGLHHLNKSSAPCSAGSL